MLRTKLVIEEASRPFFPKYVRAFIHEKCCFDISTNVILLIPSYLFGMIEQIRTFIKYYQWCWLISRTTTNLYKGKLILDFGYCKTVWWNFAHVSIEVNKNLAIISFSFMHYISCTCPNEICIWTIELDRCGRSTDFWEEKNSSRW